MVAFSSILNIHETMVQEGTCIPVWLEDAAIVGTCAIRVVSHKVIGEIEVDDDCLGGINFYYQIYPLPHTRLRYMRINFVRVDNEEHSERYN
ncbi:MAG: hypothetical protein QM802_23400 [Agriterribacter sp.]